MEEEIDLRKYIDVVIRRWKWIVALTLAAVVTATIVSFLLPPVYEAQAGVVILKSESEITFEPKYRTLTEEELAGAGVDIASRRKALEALVENSSLAVEVIAELGPTLDPEERKVEVLLDMVKAETTGDLIEIAVRSPDPKKAAAIANAWGRTYETYVNQLYSGRPQSPNDIQSQAVEAEASYQQAEQTLTQFLGDNQISALQLEIEAKEKLIASYKNAQTMAQTTVFDKQLETKQQVLANYYGDLVHLEQLLADARALQGQLQVEVVSPSAATGDALALMFLRTEAFASSASLPVQLQISLREGMEGPAARQAEDVQALIAILETRLEETQGRIDALSAQLLASKDYELTTSVDDPISRLINKYLQELLQLEEQLEQENATKRELTSARDLAWETYQTLARKEAEVGIAAQVTDTEVRFGVPAVEPEKAVAPRKKLNIAMAGVLGLMVGVLGAFVLEYLRPPAMAEVARRKQ